MKMAEATFSRVRAVAAAAEPSAAAAGRAAKGLRMPGLRYEGHHYAAGSPPFKCLSVTLHDVGCAQTQCEAEEGLRQWRLRSRGTPQRR